MIHVVENSTGQIVETCYEGSDVSRFTPDAYTVYNYAPRIERDKYKYVGSTLTMKIWFEMTPSSYTVPADGATEVNFDVEILNYIGGTIASGIPLPSGVSTSGVAVDNVTIIIGDNPVTGLVDLSVDPVSGTGTYTGITSTTPGMLSITNADREDYWANEIEIRFV
jgi:hypothetical protein